MPKSPFASALLAALIALAAPAVAAPVSVATPGDPKAKPPVVAPHLLDNVEWLTGKGRTYKRFQRGNVYMLDFWLPWEGFSRDALPYLKSLRQKFAQERLVFISVATAPLGSAMTPQMFLEKRVDLFDNVVVRDINSKAWLAFAEAGAGETLPGVVIVDRLGNIAWSGSPFEDVGAALQAVLDGDTARLAELVKARKADVRAMKATTEAYDLAYAHAQWKQALVEADKLIAVNTRRYIQLPRYRYQILVHLGKKEEAAAYGRTLVDGLYAEMEYELDMLAWFIVNAKLPKGTRDLDLALAAAEKAHTLSAGKDWSILDTLGRVHYSRGDLDKAIAVQKESVTQAISGGERARAEAILKAYEEKRAPPAAEGREQGD